MRTRLLALMGLGLLVLMMVGLAACGGGGGETTSDNNGQIIIPGGNPPAQVIDGPTEYNGKTPPTPPPNQDTNPPAPADVWDFGANIYSVPIDSNGTGRVVADKFSPGQKVAFIVVNENPLFLDAHDIPGSGFPILPTSSFSVQADLVLKGTASMASQDALAAQTRADLGDLSNYQGLTASSKIEDPAVIYEREAKAQGIEPYAPIPPVKSASTIQKGEIRTFVNVEPTIPPPPIPPDPEQQGQGQELRYPYEYRSSQDGRLVAIGAHCLIFLTTEINYGHPDTIQFTENRLTAMAAEFDTKIYPRETTEFAPVQNYLEGNVLKDVDRSIMLTFEDFDQSGNLVTELPGTVDTDISNEHKILIFIFKGGNGGFYTYGLSPEARQLLIEEGRQDDIARLERVGSTLYIDASNFPANDDAWQAGYSIVAHEFQHKLYADNQLPSRSTSYQWFNEGLSMLAIHLCGYTVNSGKIVPWAINGQLTTYLTQCNAAAVPMDANQFFSNQAQYGSGFLFFLYVFEHYPEGTGKRIYDTAKAGETNQIKLVEAATGESFNLTYTKFAIANFIDGIYAGNEGTFSQPWFHYNTIDLRGTVNLVSGTIVLPGVRTAYFPGDGSYPVNAIDRLVYPWGCDYFVLSNGDGRNLEVTLRADRNFKIFMLPVTFDSSINAVTVTPNVTIN